MGFDNDHLGTLMPFGAPSTPSFPGGVTNRLVKPGSNIVLEIRGYPLYMFSDDIWGGPRKR
jgi:hypothetical protein